MWICTAITIWTCTETGMSSAGAYYMGVGIYLDMDANANVLTKKFSANLYDKKYFVGKTG